MFAIPVSLLTWGFEAEAERCAKKARKELKRQKSFAETVVSEKPPILQVASTTSDEEYQRIIAKESSDSSLDDQIKKEHVKDLVDDFLLGDHDSRKFNALTVFLTNQLGDASLLTNEALQDAMARDMNMLQHRMNHLESIVGGRDSKLDTLCSLLEQKQRPRLELT
jgi:hypothetical protein